MKTNSTARTQESRPFAKVLWNVRKALAATPYLRQLTGTMRDAYCRLAHARRMLAKDRHNDYLKLDVRRAEEEVRKIQKEIDDVGAISYQHYARGILILPAYVGLPETLDKGKAKMKGYIYLVWRDTRNTVESYCTVADLHRTCDLLSSEKPLPASWTKS